MELNPNHPATQQLSDHWHKIVALLLHRYGDVVITLDEVRTLPQDAGVTFQELDDGLHVRLVSREEGERLATLHGGRPS